MDFNSWRPEDTARRFSLMVACCVGVFAFIALWMGLPLNFFLSLLAGAAIGGLTHLVAYPIVLAIYRR